MSKFNPINPPFGWEESWTKYPHGYTIYEALLDWLKTVNSLIDHTATLEQNINVIRQELDSFIATVNSELQDIATTTLNTWLSDGTFETIVNDVLLSQKADKVLLGTFLDIPRDGLTPVGATINTIISGLSDGDLLIFPEGNYFIETPILWNKKIRLQGQGNARLVAGALIDSVVIASNFTTYTHAFMDGLYLDGNNLANHCLKIDGSSLYAVRTSITGCEMRSAILDGIIIVPPAWSIFIEKTLSNSHGRDGLRAIMLSNSGINQLNHIVIDHCTLNDNVGAGVNILGIINSITNCDIENNLIGVKVDITQGSAASDTFLINVLSNYIEGNTLHQLFAKTLSGDGITLNVKNNYINSASKGNAIIKCEGIASAINLILAENRFENSTTNEILLDGGNCLSTSSMIEFEYSDKKTKYINLGDARVVADQFMIQLVPATCSTMPESAFSTGNINSLTPKTVDFALPFDVQFKKMKYLGFKVDTDGTAFNVTCTVSVVNNEGVNVAGPSYVHTGTTSNSFETFITNDLGEYRIPSEHYVRILFTLNSLSGGTFLKIRQLRLGTV